MESTLGLLAIVTVLASALTLYLASPNRIWQPGAGRPGLRALGGALALVSLGTWIVLFGVGVGVCVMLATWMLALMSLPYLAWWAAPRAPVQNLGIRDAASTHAARR